MDQASERETGHRKFPLVLPKEELDLRTRPAVTDEDLQGQGESLRSRPEVNPEEIYREEEHIIYNGRITGKKHSMDTSAAPLRTRIPEEKERVRVPKVLPVTNPKNEGTKQAKVRDDFGRPERTISERQAPMPKHPPMGKKKPKKKPWRALLIALLCLLLAGGVVFGVYRISSVNRPVDPHETEASETDPVETNSPETQPDETTPPETKTAETEPSETDPVETEAPEIRYTVTVEAFGREPVTKTTGAVTVGEFLKAVGFELSATDRPSVSTDTLIEEDMVIVIDQVEYKTEQVSSTISYKTEKREVQTIPRGESKVIQQGVEGVKTVSYQVEYVNGMELSRTEAGETVTREPVSEIIEVGVGGEFVGEDGKTYTFSYLRVVSATYYRLEGPTWLGHDANENTVAANLNNLPLGTKLYVKSENYDFGPRVVEDTGSSTGYDILLWIPENSPLMAAFAEGRYIEDVVIYYLD